MADRCGCRMTALEIPSRPAWCQTDGWNLLVARARARDVPPSIFNHPVSCKPVYERQPPPSHPLPPLSVSIGFQTQNVGPGRSSVVGRRHAHSTGPRHKGTEPHGAIKQREAQRRTNLHTHLRLGTKHVRLPSVSPPAYSSSPRKRTHEIWLASVCGPSNEWARRPTDRRRSEQESCYRTGLARAVVCHSAGSRS